MPTYIVSAEFHGIEAETPEQAAAQIREAWNLHTRALRVAHVDGEPIGPFEEDATLILPPLKES